MDGWMDDGGKSSKRTAVSYRKASSRPEVDGELSSREGKNSSLSDSSISADLGRNLIPKEDPGRDETGVRVAHYYPSSQSRRM